MNSPFKLRSVAVILISLLVAATALRAGEADMRQPLPDAAQQKEALVLVKLVFKAEYARTSPADKAALAQKLLDAGRQTNNDFAAKYMHFNEARNLAVAAFEIDTALQAVDEIAAAFFTVRLAERVAALQALSAVGRAREQALPLGEAALMLADEALLADDFDKWKLIQTVLDSASLRAGDQELKSKTLQKIAEASIAQRGFTAFKAVLDKLKTSPDDPAANLQAGKYYALQKGDWERALPALSRAADDPLKIAAQKELAKPEDAAAQAAVGDAWWDVAEKQTGIPKSRLQTHAMDWYTKALPQMTGLEKAKIEKRLTVAAQAGLSPNKGGDMFTLRNKEGRKAMVKLHGGSDDTERAVDAALKWLAANQEANGRWDAKKHEAGEKTDTAVTAFAILAFLGAGHSEKGGLYQDNVKRGVAWLKSKQAATGLIFDTSDAGGHRGQGYPGAIATIAICEAAGMSKLPDTMAAAQKAVNYCTEIHQAGEGKEKSGWRYAPKQEGDTSVAAWFISALKAASSAGLKVNSNSLEGATKFLDSVEVKGPGQTMSTYKYMVNTAHEPHRLTAIGCVCRLYLGAKKDDLQPTVEGFVALGGRPDWRGNGQGADLYYWYYGTLATFQQGGDSWSRWNEALKNALVPNQQKAAEKAGSWNPVGAYSGEWGRVGQTALAALCLQVYYRYPRTN